MNLQVYLNKEQRGPDYIVLQKQRLAKAENGNSYKTVCVGSGNAETAPDGEVYIHLKIDGITDNKPN